MKSRVLFSSLLMAPWPALAHPAPFGHTHGWLDAAEHPLVALGLLALIVALAWVALLDRR